MLNHGSIGTSGTLLVLTMAAGCCDGLAWISELALKALPWQGAPKEVQRQVGKHEDVHSCGGTEREVFRARSGAAHGCSSVMPTQHYAHVHLVPPSSLRKGVSNTAHSHRAYTCGTSPEIKRQASQRSRR